jgi:hypothetical protein
MTNDNKFLFTASACGLIVDSNFQSHNKQKNEAAPICRQPHFQKFTFQILKI